MKDRKHCDPTTSPDQSMAVLGHELDNVLNGMLGMTRLLRETGLSPEQDRWSRAIEHSGQQLRRLVSAFRAADGSPDPSRSGEPGSGRRPPALGVREPLDGIELLEQAVISQAPLAAQRCNRMLLTVDPEIPPDWHGDACRLRQLLDNLLGNANKFTAHGEIELCAICGSGDADEGRRALQLSISDSGPGVDPAAASRIFDAWEQESDRTGLVYGGSGLGLFVCREAVNAMGGTIELSSAPGGGARFEVSLPGLLAGGEPAPPPPSAILRRLVCQLDLADPLRASLAGWLRRLGIEVQGVGEDRPRGAPSRLHIRVSEVPGAAGPAPCLLFVPLDGRPEMDCARCLAAPIVGSSLGPRLLAMALEWLWLSDGKRGSTP